MVRSRDARSSRSAVTREGESDPDPQCKTTMLGEHRMFDRFPPFIEATARLVHTCCGGSIGNDCGDLHGMRVER